MISDLIYGFSVSLQPNNLLHCFVGVLIGTLVGVLPGLGPVATISMLLPVTFHISSPASAIIMLAGIYYGAMYGGSTTSILVNVPGESASVVTTFDGYQMARQGRAGAALGISAFGSFIAGTLSVIGLMLLARPLARYALKFGPPEYCAVMFLAFTVLSYIASGSMIRAMMMAGFGLLLGCVGMDFISGVRRFSYGVLALEDGLGLVPICMGFFGLSEVLLNIEDITIRTVYESKIKGLYPSKKDWKTSIGAIGRGSVVGFTVGILPGIGPTIASFMSYGMEKRVAKDSQNFGKGDIRGVAGPEAANNAAATGAFVPLLTLGIPGTGGMAMLLGALLMYGVQPGPLLIQRAPEIFWGTITSMYTGNILLLILNLPLIALWVRVLKVPYSILFSLILLFSLTGVYSINNSIADILIMNIFGIVGYFMKKMKYEGGPFILAFVLGPMFESNLRRSLMMSKGSVLIFFTRPICLVLVIVAFLSLMSPLVMRRKEF
jgi:putative tricarboxylic transport membrane protein